MQTSRQRATCKYRSRKHKWSSALTITAESIYQRNEADFISTEVDYENDLMNINDSGYLGLE